MEKIIISEELQLLSSNGDVFVGRKKSIFERHGAKASIYLGKVGEGSPENKDYFGKKILVDSISPHAIFICGMRGSGKSYTLGVIAEELALKNDAVGVIIIDPMGIFWSMKNKNTVDREQSLLKEWMLEPKGMENITVFVPAGHTKKAPKKTWDKIFTIKPSELTVDDWCLTFGFDRFDVMGLLVDRVLEKVRIGYVTQDGKRVGGLDDEYRIEDMIRCIEREEGINSPTRGFKTSTRRALVARLKGAIEWGIFDVEGTEIKDLSRRGQIAVIDVSFLEDNVRSLVVGIIARNILNTRKILSRQEAAGTLTQFFGTVPVTWLMIDEAHILVPGGGKKTAATDSLIEYVRQGRQPGCSIVLATQQPSAIDSRILSQVDILICHKLVYEDDIKAVQRRMPSEMPQTFKSDRFIKNLPLGMAIIGDKQEETSRAFLARIRPRISQHEGRERQPVLDVDPGLMKVNVKNLILEKFDRPRSELQKIIDIVNEEYKLNFDLDEILEELRKEKRIPEKEEKPMAKPEFEEVEEDTNIVEIQREKLVKVEEVFWEGEKEEELKELKLRREKVITSHIEEKVSKLAEKVSRKFFLKKKEVEVVYKIYYPVWQVFFDYYPTKGNYESLSCFVDGITGEILLKNGKRTRGIRDLIRLTPTEREFMLYLFEMENVTQVDVIKDLGYPKQKLSRVVRALSRKGLVGVNKSGKFEVIIPKISYNIVQNPKDSKVKKLKFEIAEDFLDDDAIIENLVREKDIPKALEVWNRVQVWKSELVYYPYWIVVYNGDFDIIDGVFGKKNNYVKSMLRFRV